jgi:hypothetical protein
MTPDDYYDPETDEYVLFTGTSVTCLQTDVRIKDLDGEILECYLTSVELIEATERGRRDVYKIRYKVY